MPVCPRANTPKMNCRFPRSSRLCASTRLIAAGKSSRSSSKPVLRPVRQTAQHYDSSSSAAGIINKRSTSSWFTSSNRLARNLADHVAIRAQLRRVGVTQASVTESLEDSVSGQLVEHILASMAEFYSAKLSEEVKKGMRQKVLQGGWPHQPPRGYRVLRGETLRRSCSMTSRVASFGRRLNWS